MRFASVSSGGAAIGAAGAAAFFGRLLAATAAAPFAVEASAEHGDDRDDVIGEVLFGGLCVVCLHDDFGTVLREYELDEIVRESAEAVFVGNVHASYTPLIREL